MANQVVDKEVIDPTLGPVEISDYLETHKDDFDPDIYGFLIISELEILEEILKEYPNVSLKAVKSHKDILEDQIEFILPKSESYSVGCSFGEDRSKFVRETAKEVLGLTDVYDGSNGNKISGQRISALKSNLLNSVETGKIPDNILICADEFDLYLELKELDDFIMRFDNEVRLNITFLMIKEK